MSRNAYGSFPQWDRPHRSLRTWQKVIYILLLPVLLFYELVSGSPVAFAAMMPPTGAAAANPNPTLSAPAAAAKAIPHTLVGKLVSSTPPKQAVGQVIDPRIAAPVDALLTTSAQTIVSKDGHLSVDVPAGAVTTQQITSAGGAIHLKIVQLSSTSGGQASGNLMLGGYQLQLLSVLGKPLTTLVLAQPLTLRYHLNASQQTQVREGQEIDALWQNTSASLTSSSSSPLAPNASSSSSTSTHVPLRLQTKQDAGQPSWSVSTRLQDPTASQTTPGNVKPAATAASPSTTTVASPAASSSTVTFNTVTPEASWGQAQGTDVGLNAGSLDYSYPIDVPDGPSGLAPALSLSYSSGAVDQNTNSQAAAPWTGEGWSLGLGAISWSQLDVNPSANTLDNVWTISDPSGISGQLIPPNIGDTTAGTSPVPALSALPVTWHSAPESHDKIEEIQGGSQPCWQVWLSNGTMEEFGCTSDARQSALDAKNASSPYLWDLDAIVDRFGNQIRVHYQRISVSSGVQDAVISDIEYDDPNCHLLPTGTAILGTCSSWNPQVKIVFDSSTKVAALTNSDGCASWSSTTFRCDDPVSVSGGIAAPKAVSSYVLNDVKVESQGNVLHEYAFSYDQSTHQQVQDPATGEQKSVAGYLNLTKIQQLGTDGTPLNAPVTTMTYSKQTEHYEDLSYKATPTTNCGPSWNTGCYLWSQTYNNYYISNLDNGEGWHETVTWKEARNNTYGVYVPSGTTVDVLNPFSCDGQEANYPCNEADYRAWSRMVVTARTAVTNGVSSTWSYQYKISTLGTNNTVCLTQSVCGQGFTWGDINDNDYADYYNTQFISFAQTQVTQPDGTYQIHAFNATPGLGLATSSIKCYYIFTDTNGNKTPHCGVAPYWNTNPGLGGQETEVQSFSSTGQLMQDTRSTYALNCPPAGVAGSVGAAGGIYDPGTGYLFSELDGDNPVVVCDSRVTQEDTYQVDGVATVSNFTTNANVVHTTTQTTYDGSNQGSSHVSGYDYGNVSKVDVTGNDVNGVHDISGINYYPNDAVSGSSPVYLTSLPSSTYIQDNTGTYYRCGAITYGANSGPSQAPTIPTATQNIAYTAYTNSSQCSGSSITIKHGYEASGNATTAIDGDGHLGCTSGSSTYSACAKYDALDTHLVSALNAKNQTASDLYNPTADGGYNQWLMATTNANGQSTLYQYDALGRLTAEADPGDTLNSPTVTYTYNNTCTVGSTDPCLEIDTTTRETVGGSQTLTTQQWYDGQGRVVETKTPGPNLLSKVPRIGSTLVTYTIYDNMGRATTTSQAYAVASTTGTGYLTPDLTQPRTVVTYDSLGRQLTSVTYQDASTIVLKSSKSYTLAQGLSSFSADTTTPFAQSIGLDAYNHKQISYTDALGRAIYEQVFSGTGTASSPYAVVRTIQYAYDVVGNLLSTNTYDSTGTLVASQNTTYDGVGRKTGMNDSDSGSCRNTPMPATCSSSADTAWKYHYDNDGNLLSQTDPRGVSTYMSYDTMDRLLCTGTTSTSVTPCGSSAYATYFYDSYDNTSNPGVTFPTGCVAPSGSSASDPIGAETAETFSASVGNGWRCAGYDQRGQVDQSGLSVTADGTTTTQAVEQSYNDMGQPTTLTYPDGEAVTDQYDSNDYYRSTYFGTPSSTSPVNFLVGQTSYTNTGEVSGMALGGSAAITSQPTPVFSTAESYDGIGRAISTSATRNGSTIWNQSKTYDNVGNTSSLTTTLPTTSGGTQTDSQSFCYDSLNRLVWAGNTGTPTGGDHCGATPTGTTISGYQQSFSYDALDRLISGPAGTETYGTTPTHAATTLSTVPNQYASYDAMGDMTCRNVDTTASSTQGCDASQTGALMSYDNEGRLSSWTAPGASTATPSDQFLYDNSGKRVLQRIDNGTGSPTDTISFDGYTDVTINGGQTSTTKYYAAGGQTVALRKDGVLSYLVPSALGSVSLTLYADGSTESVQLYAPYGATRYSDGTTPTVYGFTGQRFDSTTGLMYYGARYYDPVSGRFISADGVENNATGDDPYAYVADNPETMTDPSGNAHIDQAGDTSWTVPYGNQPTVVSHPDGEVDVVGTSSGSGSAGNYYTWGSQGDGWIYGTSFVWTGNGGTGKAASKSHSSSSHHAAAKKSASSHKTDVVKAVLKAGLSVILKGLDLVLGISSMVNDWNTLTDSNASFWDKAAAAADLAFNVGMDASMFLGVGEGLKIADISAHLAEMLVDHGGEDVAEHVAEGAAEACGGLSFAFATKVAVSTGEQAIGTLKPGDQVWAYNQQTKKMELEVVRHLWITQDNDLVDLTLTTKTSTDKGKPAHQTSETVHTNKKHPFLTVEKGFLPVAQLKLGMHIVEAGGRVGVVTSWKSVSGIQTMYNLEVTQDHTYTVGDSQFVVHNDLACGIHSTLKYVRRLLGKTPSEEATNEVLAREPNCAYCGNPSEVADHEPSLQRRWESGEYDNMNQGQIRSDADDPSRMVGSCTSCNSSKGGRALDGGGGGWNSETSPSNMRQTKWF